MGSLLEFADAESLALSACYGPVLWPGAGLTFHAACSPEWAPFDCAVTDAVELPEDWQSLDCLAAVLSCADGDWQTAEHLFMAPASDPAALAREALAALEIAGEYSQCVTLGGGSLLRVPRSAVGRRPGWLNFDGRIACHPGKMPPLAGRLVVPEGVVLYFGREPLFTAAFGARQWDRVVPANLEIDLPPAPSVWRDVDVPGPFNAPIRLRRRATPDSSMWLLAHDVFRNWVSAAPEDLLRRLECWPGNELQPWIIRSRGGAHLPFMGHYSPDGGRIWFPEGTAPVPRINRMERFRAAWMAPGAIITVVCADGRRWHASGAAVELCDCIRWEVPPAERMIATSFGAFWNPEAFRCDEDQPASPAPLPLPKPKQEEEESYPEVEPKQDVAIPFPELLMPRDDGVQALEEAILACVARGGTPDADVWRAISEAKARAGQYGEAISCLAAARLCDPAADVHAGVELRRHLTEQSKVLVGGATSRADVHLTRCLACLHWGLDGASVPRAGRLVNRLAALGWAGATATWFSEKGHADLPVQEWWLLGRSAYGDDVLGVARVRDSVLRRLHDRPAEYRLGMPDFLGRLGVVAQPARLSGLGRAAIEWSDAARGERGRTSDYLRMSLDCLGLDVGWQPEDFRPRDAAERAIAASFAWRKRNPQGVLPPEVLELVGKENGLRYVFEILRNFSRVLSPYGLTNAFAHWAAQSSPFGQSLARMADAIAVPARAPEAFAAAASHAEAREARGAPRLAALALTVAPSVDVGFCRQVLEYAVRYSLYVPERSSSAANQEAAKLAELVIGVALHADVRSAFEKGCSHVLALAGTERFDLNELEARAFSSYHRRGSRQEVAGLLTAIVATLNGRVQWPARAASLYAAAALYRCRERQVADACVQVGFTQLPSATARDRRFFAPALAHAACSHPDAIDGMAAAERLLSVLPPECDELSTSSHYSCYQIKLIEAMILGFAGAGKPPPGVEQWADESESHVRRDMHRAVGVNH